MASVEKRVRDGKVTWLARWRDPDGRQRKKSFSRKLDAERHLTAVTAAMLRGDYIDMAEARRITVTEQVRRWAETRVHGDRTRLRTESNIRCHIEGTRLGGLPLASVRPSDVQSWVSERSAVLAPTTVRLVVGLVRGAFAAAVHDRLLSSNPAASRLALPRVQASRLVPLTVQQVRSLAEAMPARCRAMVITQAGLGLRVGELLALRVEDVDFLGRTVRVEWQLAKGTRERVRPKTATSIRTVPLPAVVADALAAHLAAFAPRPGGLMFTTPMGMPHWHEHYGTRIFQRGVQDAGLPAGTSTHDLRHHYASVLLAAGESVVAVAERLGHEDATLVLTTYGHLMPDSEHRTRRAVDDAWRAPSVPQAEEEAL